MQSRHGHHGKQTDGLQGDGLSSGVGTGYHQCPEVLPQFHVDRHYFLRVYQRMSGLSEFQIIVFVHLRLFGLHLHRQPSLCKDDVQVHQDPLVVQKFVEMFRDTVA